MESCGKIAVDGFLAGGIEEIVVWDGHNGSRTLSLTTLHPKAKLMIGSPGITLTLEAWTRDRQPRGCRH